MRGNKSIKYLHRFTIYANGMPFHSGSSTHLDDSISCLFIFSFKIHCNIIIKVNNILAERFDVNKNKLRAFVSKTEKSKVKKRKKTKTKQNALSWSKGQILEFMISFLGNLNLHYRNACCDCDETFQNKKKIKKYEMLETTKCE